MTRLNLLPWREMRRKEQDRQLLSIAVGTWILMGLIVFYAHLNVSAKIDNQNKRNQFLESEIAKVDEQIKEIKQLKQQRRALISRMDIIYRLQVDRTMIVHVFDELARKLPEGVYLKTVSQKGRSFVIEGVAQSNARVSALMRNLDSSEWFASPELDVINVSPKDGDRVSLFKMKVNQVTKGGSKKPGKS